MEEKMKDEELIEDINMVLRPGIDYNNNQAFEFICKELLGRL
jgi:hypothetical protein